MKMTGTREVVYIDYINGRFEAWIYRRGVRIDLSIHDEMDIKAYLNKWDCKAVLTDEAKLFSHYLPGAEK
jgi:hypothetical protein